MTRLLHPSIGELIDRLTILELKITHARAFFITTAGFEAEQQGVKAAVDLAVGAQADLQWAQKFVKTYTELLSAVNSKLWALEDEIRELPDPSAGSIAPEALLRLGQVAKLIVYLNDQRSKAVQCVNEAFGERGQEKIYRSSTGDD